MKVCKMLTGGASGGERVGGGWIKTGEPRTSAKRAAARWGGRGYIMELS